MKEIFQDTDSASAKRKRKSARKFFRVTFFLFLIAVSTTVAVDTHNEYLQHFHSSICTFFVGDIFLVDQQRLTPNWKTIVTINDWWNWIEWLIKYKLYNKEKSQSQQPTFWVENILVTTPLLRQIRVEEGTCVIPEVFERYFKYCYGSYEPQYEYKNETFKGTPYVNYSDYPAEPVNGFLTTYIGPGYVQKMSIKRKKNLKIIKKLRAKEWIDRGTRLVVLEFAFFNRNLDFFANFQIFAEKLTTGNIITKFDIRLLPLYCIKRSARVLLTASLFYAVVVYSLSSTLWDLKRSGVYSYLRNIWNFVNLAFIASAYASVFLAHKHMQGMNALIEEFNSDSETKFIESLGNVYIGFKLTLMIDAALAWIMLFRFIGFTTIMLNFSHALQKGYPGIFGFSVMFMVVFFAFALWGCILFSKGNPAFTTFSKSLDTVMRMVMTDFQYDFLEKADKVIGPCYFLAFILFMFFVLLNTFLAVIGDSYVETREKDTIGFSVIRTSLKIIKKYMLRWCKIKRRKKLQDDSDSPRVIDENEALTEFFGKDSINDGETKSLKRRKFLLKERVKDYERLSAYASRLETHTELLIQKMERIIQKLETIIKT